MLIAELRGKIGSALACSACGADVPTDTATHFEDVLTSHVFGVLRHLPFDAAMGRLLRHWGLGSSSGDDGEVEFWPNGAVQMVPVGESLPCAVGLEPDVVVAGGGIACVEVKLGMRLGTDVLQLPKEVLWTLERAAGRDWRLICLTADAAEPQLTSFAVASGKMALAGPASVATAVASYFAAAAQVYPGTRWPCPAVVAERVIWMSWSDLAHLLADWRDEDALAPHARRALADVVQLLDRRELVRRRFHGFRPALALDEEHFGPVWSTSVPSTGFSGFARLEPVALPRLGRIWSVGAAPLWGRLRPETFVDLLSPWLRLPA